MISSSVRRWPSSSAFEQHADDVVLRVGATLGDDSREVLVQCGRRSEAAVHVEADADELDREAMELRQVFAGSPSSRAITTTGNGNVSSRTRSA